MIFRNDDGTFSQELRNGFINTFDKAGNHLDSVDRGGRAISFQYDDTGRLIKSINPIGGEVQYFYGEKYLESIIDTAGRETSFIYENGNLTEVIYPDQESRKFAYDENSLIVKQVDQINNEEKIVYNEQLRLVKVIDSKGYETIFDDSASRLIESQLINTEDGVELKTLGLDVSQLNETVVDANGNKTVYSKGESGFLDSILDSEGQVTKYIRDDLNRITKIIKDDGSFREFTYNDKNDLTSEFDSLTNVTVSKKYDDYGNILEMINEQGVKVSNTYNSQGLLTSSVTSEGDGQSLEYDNVTGLVTKSSNSLGIETSFEYDLNGNLTSVIENNGLKTTFLRDQAGNVIQKVNSNGDATEFSFDENNRLTSVLTAKLEMSSYSYSKRGELLEITDPLGKKQTFSYDSVGNLVESVDQNGHSSIMSYDGNKNLTSLIDKGDRFFSFEYNSNNMLLKKKLPDDTFSYAYDDYGNVINIESNTSKISLTYNGFKKVTSIVSTGKASLSSLPEVSLTYEYDDYGNKVSMSSPFGDTLYDYDKLNQLIGLKNHKDEVFEFERDVEGKVVKSILPNIVSSYQFDEVNRLNHISHSTSKGHISLFDHIQVDGIGNKLKKNTSGGSYTYTYDKNSQLISSVSTEAPFAEQNESFNYDEIGNQIGNNEKYNDSKTYLLENFESIFVYDVFGNLISEQRKSDISTYTLYRYNSTNQLVEIKKYKANILIMEAIYAYDALGRRVVKDIRYPSDATGNTTRIYGYDGNEVLFEFDGSNELLATYTHSTLRTDDVLAVDVSDAGVLKKISKTKGTFFFLKDAVGSITDIVDAQGDIVQKYVYSAFGKILAIRNYADIDISSNVALKTLYAFTGREYDEESSLYYYRARYYNPRLGRFIQYDLHPGVLSNPLTVINKYIYVLNNPINNVDPSGLFFKKLWSKVKRVAKKVMKNKVTGLIISSITAGSIGALSYVNLSGQFHANDVAMINLAAVTAAAVATGGAAGAWAGGLAGGGLGGAAAGLGAGAVAGGLTGGVVGGTLASMNGGSFSKGFLSGAVTGMIAGGMAGAYAGYFSNGIENSIATNEIGGPEGGWGISEGCASASNAMFAMQMVSYVHLVSIVAAGVTAGFTAGGSVKAWFASRTAIKLGLKASKHSAYLACGGV